MKAVFKTVFPYQEDEMNLPVANLEEAIPFYENVMGFRVLSRQDLPIKSAVLSRDEVTIGLAENGGDPAQDGCFFEVDNVETAFAELQAKGLPQSEPNYQIQTYEVAYKVFFVTAPDELCYCLGEVCK
jgi:catechol 2,3-dioxygenase-like lactoylglutathione lyase family enzyme